jgi:hypothetical protein
MYTEITLDSQPPLDHYGGSPNEGMKMDNDNGLCESAFQSRVAGMLEDVRRLRWKNQTLSDGYSLLRSENESLKADIERYETTSENCDLMRAELADFKQGAKAEADAGDEARAECRKLRAAPAPSVVQDARRGNWLIDYMASPREELDELLCNIFAGDDRTQMRAEVDALMAKEEGPDYGDGPEFEGYAERAKAAKPSCKGNCETWIGNRSTGHIQCADCGRAQASPAAKEVQE